MWERYNERIGENITIPAFSLSVYSGMVIMELRRNEGMEETGNSRENPLTNGIVRHDSHMRKSEVTRPGIEPGPPWWEASRL
ncbi:hypothetical protein PR048_011599 [Dryococelus australis]|uniref:Uncharacterized protein n=1 Tax=Dryococelus australis TaxID=614101 RepID=A0ABQ9HM62_9NEOP|nr:hypothetical protein PR048_011599 [Dryococelus australis]